MTACTEHHTCITGVSGETSFSSITADAVNAFSCTRWSMLDIWGFLIIFFGTLLANMTEVSKVQAGLAKVSMFSVNEDSRRHGNQIGQDFVKCLF